ncbi:hypothetical protein ONZ51_g3361 [Trametes cubensis]|uniref:Reverse transcriptase/retrotransposon-derived protein RNase H-like domain-containing protein n=1 Tax=Trametes cubensis TaxID=1111947 RepID=A0AAD7XB79_9APHY|nr:hypothetical protein ONZ51_g3361 [Trametes cubensis]
MERNTDPDSERLTFNPSRAIELWYRKKKIRKINKSTEIAIAAKKDQKEKTLDKILPDFVKDYQQVFEKKASSRFPPSRPWDHAIEFKKDFDHHTKGSWRKIYPLTYTEHIELDKFIAENLEKDYIQKFKSPLASPFFFVTKKDGSLRPVQNYRALNERTIKNAYPLPHASKVATGAVLRQQGEDRLWHPCAYLSKSFTPAERNYQIYDRELLAIV